MGTWPDEPVRSLQFARSVFSSVWAACGVTTECGRLRAVLMHRPGREIDDVADASQALWHDLLDPARARDQHDRLTDLYRSRSVEVHESVTWLWTSRIPTSVATSSP